MDFVINTDELEAIYGLPHIQQLAYLRGIRPYMDVKTGITGMKRGISYQSIAEQLYIEPHPGIKSQKISRDQVRRAISSLARAGIIEIQSEGMQLIMKCLLASQSYSTQNKAAINPPQQAALNPCSKTPINTESKPHKTIKADTLDSQKAATPLKENNYIYLLSQFEKFWAIYPEKKSRERAFEIFMQISPDENLLQTILQALKNQISARNLMQADGRWMPPWKYPTNWLAQHCWEDEVEIEVIKEKGNAKRGSNIKYTDHHDPFWCGETEDTASSSGCESEQSNIIELLSYRQRYKAN